MFPSLESRSQSAADIPEVSAPDATLNSPLPAPTHAEQGTDADSLPDLPPASSSDRPAIPLDGATGTGDALNQAQQIGPHARRVSFAAPLLQSAGPSWAGADQEASPGPQSIPENTHEAGMSVLPSSPSAAIENGGQLATDEFEALMAGKDAVQAR